MLHPSAGGGSTIFGIGEMSLWKEKADNTHAWAAQPAKTRARAFAAAGQNEKSSQCNG